MAARKHWVVEVTWTGMFPVDMLRYDCAWPHTQADVTKMFSSFNRRDPNPNTARVVMQNKPTTARWASFGAKAEARYSF